jgi:hypothetical protein
MELPNLLLQEVEKVSGKNAGDREPQRDMDETPEYSS